MSDLAAAPIGPTSSTSPASVASTGWPGTGVASASVQGTFADAMASATATGSTGQSRNERYAAAARGNVQVITDLLARERANASNHAYVNQLESIRNEYKERLARNRMFLRGEDPGPRDGVGSIRTSVETADDTITTDPVGAPDLVDDDDGWVEEIENSMPEYVPGEMPAEPATTSDINGVAPYADPNYGLGRVTTMSVEAAWTARTAGITWESGQLDEKGKPLWIKPDQLKTYWNNVVGMLTTGGMEPYQVFPEATRGNTAYNMDTKRYLEFLGFWDGSSLWSTRDVNSQPIDEVISRYEGILTGTVPYTGVNTGWGMDNPSTVSEVKSTLDYLKQLKAQGLTNLGLQPGLI